MSLQLIGLNHKTAPLEVRERLAFKEDNCISALRTLTDGALVQEALILSTCNRVEILVEGDSDSALTNIIGFLAEHKQLSPDVFAEHLYHLTDEAAVRHLFRVASSLDSMIVGETQILGQVRAAYSAAAQAGTARRKIHKLLHHAFRAAKRVRNDTRIGSRAVSVGLAAVEKARNIFGTLENKTALLLGAGETGELVAKYLAHKGASRILICNRTTRNADRLAAEIGGEVGDFENLQASLPAADVVICSTSASDFLISPEMALYSQKAREHRPALFIDISVPRNIDPEVAGIQNVFLYDVDDLRSVISSDFEAREREILRAERIVEEEAVTFWKCLPALEKGEMFGLLRQKMQDAARRELERCREQLGDLSPVQEVAIERLLLRAADKIANPVIYGLRRSHEAGATEFAEILRAMLGDEAEPAR